jgi:hypothetical protein
MQGGRFRSGAWAASLKRVEGGNAADGSPRGQHPDGLLGAGQGPQLL